ncbi:MAG: hypothetical protein QW199_02880 [Candidatus Pacearchaeota archaeon]
MGFTIEKLGKILLGLLAFTLIIIIIFLLARTLYSGIKIDQEMIQKTEPLRTELLKNFEYCDKIDDDVCFCEIFPNFPATLPKEFILNFTSYNDKTNVSVLANNRLIDSVEINKKFYWWWQSPPDTITFGEAFPIVKGNYIISSQVLKNNGEFWLVVGEKEKYDEVKQKISAMPKCTSERKKSIDFTRNLAEPLASYKGLNVNIGENFYILIDESSIALYDKSGNIVKEVEIKKPGLERLMLWKVHWPYEYWEAKEVKLNIANLSCDGKKLELHKGDSINIETKDEKHCIRKIS